MTDNILASMVGEGHVRITPPTDDDSEGVKNVKLFLLACMHRAQMDETFMEDVFTWMRDIGKDQFLANAKLIQRH